MRCSPSTTKLQLLRKPLYIKSMQAGSLLKIVRTVQSMQIKGAEDFGEDCHTASTEPYFYNSYALPIDK